MPLYIFLSSTPALKLSYFPECMLKVHILGIKKNVCLNFKL